MTQRFFFKKEERLTGDKKISELFDKGTNINDPLIRAIYRIPEEDMNTPAKVLFSVPKRHISKSFLRNRIKRKMREGYRQEKHQLYEILNTLNIKIHIAYIYNSSKEVDFETIKKVIVKSFNKIN